MARRLDLLIDGIDFGEGPRWHDGRLWYSDFFQRSISAVTIAGEREVVHGDLADRPSGLGWLPDGSLLVVMMTERRLMVERDGALVTHADLSSLAPAPCNDMVVDAVGNAYVGNHGFDFEAGEEPVPTRLILVRPDGAASATGSDVRFPNGTVITPDSTLIVGESYGRAYRAFTIADDGSLTDGRVWAETPGMAPDGCTLDADGAIWFSDVVGSQVVRIIEGGEICDRIPTPMPTFACMLGGDDGTTLFVLCAPTSRPDVVAGQAAGAIFATEVATPHAGLP